MDITILELGAMVTVVTGTLGKLLWGLRKYKNEIEKVKGALDLTTEKLQDGAIFAKELNDVIIKAADMVEAVDNPDAPETMDNLRALHKETLELLTAGEKLFSLEDNVAGNLSKEQKQEKAVYSKYFAMTPISDKPLPCPGGEGSLASSYRGINEYDCNSFAITKHDGEKPPEGFVTVGSHGAIRELRDTDGPNDIIGIRGQFCKYLEKKPSYNRKIGECVVGILPHVVRSDHLRPAPEQKRQDLTAGNHDS
jgi:hypothetical protein